MAKLQRTVEESSENSTACGVLTWYVHLRCSFQSATLTLRFFLKSRASIPKRRPATASAGNMDAGGHCRVVFSSRRSWALDGRGGGGQCCSDIRSFHTKAGGVRSEGRWGEDGRRTGQGQWNADQAGRLSGVSCRARTSWRRSLCPLAHLSCERVDVGEGKREQAEADRQID